jgi:ribosomal-protein-alanine N-acetyltransferase
MQPMARYRCAFHLQCAGGRLVLRASRRRVVCESLPRSPCRPCGTIRSVTVELRSWRSADAAALHVAAATTVDLDLQLGGADLGTVSACREFIDHVLLANRPDVRNFAIADEGKAVGNVGLSNIERQHDTGWAYYWVAAQHQRRGLATQGLNTVAHWAFREVGLFRLELGHRVNNPSSCIVARRAGFASEGVERSKLRYGDERFDVELHARLLPDPIPDVLVLPYREH